MTEGDPPKEDKVVNPDGLQEIAPVADNDQPNDEYKVGPGRPPLHSQFKHGQKSANPLGRPKGSLNLATIAKKEGSKKTTVKEGGRTRTVTKMEAAIAQHWQKAMQGNIASAKLVFEQAAKADDVRSGAHPQFLVPKLDVSAMRRAAERVLRSTEEVGDGPISSD